jgi:hypothetical protein
MRKAHVVALGREKDPTPTSAWCAACVASGCTVTTSVMSWEQIYGALPTGDGLLAELLGYLEAKSHSLRPAFNLTPALSPT